MATGTRSFQDLIVWEKAMALVKDAYELSAELPSEERYNLASQIRRAAVSIPSNIAEGHGRQTRGEYIQFLGIAMGSLRELQTCVLLCESLGFRKDVSRWSVKCEEVAKMLYALQKSLKV